MTEITLLHTTGGVRVGDFVALPPLHRPKWWQFWMRWPFAPPARRYRVTNVNAMTITIED